jgi:hypothetical protein
MDTYMQNNQDRRQSPDAANGTPILRSDRKDIDRTIRLLYRPGDVVELRIPNTAFDGTVSGYFDNADDLAEAAAARNGDPAVYMTLNPVNPVLKARAHNHLKRRSHVNTTDKDILRRTFLLIDCDPTRPAEISSTDQEHGAALDRARAVRDHLTNQGWPRPLRADSGNGGHNIYRIDLANDAEAQNLLQNALKALAARFDDAAVTIDQAVSNASRISKIYGTAVRKGDHMPDRPHRLARILDAPDHLEVVPRPLLEKLAQEVAPPPPPPKDPPPQSGSYGKEQKFDIDDFMARHFAGKQPVPNGDGRKWDLDQCPFNPDHKDSAIFQGGDGKLGFHCFHNSCSGKTWKDVREFFEGPRQKRKQASYTLRVDPNLITPSIQLLNANPLFEAKIQFAWLRRRGSMIQAGFADGSECVWATSTDLRVFARSQDILFDATAFLIPTPSPPGIIHAVWEPVAQLIRKLADQDSTDLDPPLQDEFAEIIRDTWERAGRKQITGDDELIEMLQACHNYRRNHTDTAPPFCAVWLFAGDQATPRCYVYLNAFVTWLSTPAAKNKHYDWNSVRTALLMLDFRKTQVKREQGGKHVSVRLWEGPDDLMRDDIDVTESAK